jgi:hypothetical protein
MKAERRSSSIKLTFLQNSACSSPRLLRWCDVVTRGEKYQDRRSNVPDIHLLAVGHLDLMERASAVYPRRRSGGVYRCQIVPPSN